MQAYIIWFIAAFALIGAELMAGTFYLLVIGLGLACGGVAALLGLPAQAQIAVAAVIAVGGVVILRSTRAGALLRPRGPEISPDVGQAVQVLERHPDGTLRVAYRGSQWDAEAEGPATTGIGDTLYIHALRGTKLIVSAHPA